MYTVQQMQNLVNTFNEAYKIGDKVEVYVLDEGGETFTDEIVHEATIMGGHTGITWLKKCGSFNLTHVKCKVL